MPYPFPQPLPVSLLAQTLGYDESFQAKVTAVLESSELEIMLSEDNLSLLENGDDL